MSVRAHIVKEIVYGEDVFNLWFDEELVEALDDAGYLRQLNDDLCGLLEVNRDFFEAFLQLDVDPDLTKKIKELLDKYPEKNGSNSTAFKGAYAPFFYRFRQCEQLHSAAAILYKKMLTFCVIFDKIILG